MKMIVTTVISQLLGMLYLNCQTERKKEKKSGSTVGYQRKKTYKCIFFFRRTFRCLTGWGEDQVKEGALVVCNKCRWSGTV